MTTDPKTSSLPPGARRPQGQETVRTLLHRLEDAIVAGHYNRADDIVEWPAETYRKLKGMFSELLAALPSQAAPQGQETYQARVRTWVLECFGEAIADDMTERSFRFLEEALELVQAIGCTSEQASRLVEYVYNRPVGKREQEVGGVMVTLAALTSAAGIDLVCEAERELARVCAPEVTAKIRRKQAAKRGVVSHVAEAALPGEWQSPLPSQAEGQPLPPDAQERLIAEAHGYLSRLFTHYAPTCEPLPNLSGICTQIDNLLVYLSAPRSSGAAPGGQPASGEIANIVAAMRKDADDIIATHQRIGSQALGPDGLVVQTLRAWADRLATLLPSAEGQ